MNAQHKTFIAFVKLGTFLKDFSRNPSSDDTWSKKLNECIKLAGHKNGWFSRENILYSIEQWGILLTEEKLKDWLSRYDITQSQAKWVALIMAGNIPLVGFHDLLAVLLSGNKALVKLSSNDEVLTSFIREYLIEIEPILFNNIIFSKGKIEGFDAVIATGSNNTSRYFEHYFSKSPNIIRKNRNSVAVLNGKETSGQIRELGEDIFRYYGLGCRSVSKLFIPKGYQFDSFFESIYPYHPIIDQVKYANNYDYNKAVYLMSNFKLLDNGFLLLKEDTSYSSPIASLFYEHYTDTQALKRQLEKDADHLQCVVAHGFLEGEVPFGQTQKPSLVDYADGVDTVEFLLKI